MPISSDLLFHPKRVERKFKENKVRPNLQLHAIKRQDMTIDTGGDCHFLADWIRLQ